INEERACDTSSCPSLTCRLFQGSPWVAAYSGVTRKHTTKLRWVTREWSKEGFPRRPSRSPSSHTACSADRARLVPSRSRLDAGIGTWARSYLMLEKLPITFSVSHGDSDRVGLTPEDRAILEGRLTRLYAAITARYPEEGTFVGSGLINPDAAIPVLERAYRDYLVFNRAT